MIRIVLDVNAPMWAAQGVKETLGMYLERFGDCRVVSILETTTMGEQVGMVGK